MYSSFEPGIDILLLDVIRYPSNATYNLSLEIGAMRIYSRLIESCRFNDANFVDLMPRRHKSAVREWFTMTAWLYKNKMICKWKIHSGKRCVVFFLSSPHCGGYSKSDGTATKHPRTLQQMTTAENDKKTTTRFFVVKNAEVNISWYAENHRSFLCCK